MSKKTILKISENGDIELGRREITDFTNLYNSGIQTSAGELDYNGKIVSNSDIRTTDFIPVQGGQTYTIKTEWDTKRADVYWSFARFCLYDNKFNFLAVYDCINSSLTPNTSKNTTWQVLYNSTAYIRVSVSHLNQGGTLQVLKGFDGNTPIRRLNNLLQVHNAVNGYINSNGVLTPPTDDDVTSDFIPVREGAYTVQAWWDDINAITDSYMTISYFNANKQFVSRRNLSASQIVPYWWVTVYVPNNVAYVRITISYLGSLARAIFSRGTTEKYYIISAQDRIAQNKSLYSFSKDEIIVPDIIEYPPLGMRNYFIEKTSSSGYLSNYSLVSAEESDRTSDFIDISNFQNVRVRITFEGMNGNYTPYVGIAVYDSRKTAIKMLYLNNSNGYGNHTFETVLSGGYSFMRVVTNYYDEYGTTVSISVVEGNPINKKHYLAFEDMPSWVKDTGKPISISQDGIVIRGELKWS